MCHDVEEEDVDTRYSTRENAGRWDVPRSLVGYDSVKYDAHTKSDVTNGVR